MKPENELENLRRDLEAKYKRPIDKDIILILSELKEAQESSEALEKRVADAVSKINASGKFLQFTSDSQAFSYAAGRWGLVTLLGCVLAITAMFLIRSIDIDLQKFEVKEKEGLRYLELEKVNEGDKHLQIGKDCFVGPDGHIIVPLRKE